VVCATLANANDLRFQVIDRQRMATTSMPESPYSRGVRSGRDSGIGGGEGPGELTGPAFCREAVRRVVRMPGRMDIEIRARVFLASSAASRFARWRGLRLPGRTTAGKGR
jgi:hypothetical protein